MMTSFNQYGMYVSCIVVTILDQYMLFTYQISEILVHLTAEEAQEYL